MKNWKLLKIFTQGKMSWVWEFPILPSPHLVPFIYFFLSSFVGMRIYINKRDGGDLSQNHPITIPTWKINLIIQFNSDPLGEKCWSLAFFEFLKFYMLYNNLNIKLLFWCYVWFSKSIEKNIYIFFVKIKNLVLSVN